MRPNFYIVGAGRSGSTSLYAHCRRHPQIFMARIKEPNHYIFRDERPAFGGPGVARARAIAVRDERTYERLFDGAAGRPVAGEASVNYLRFPHVARAIRDATPDARLVIGLRQPVDRAYSSFVHKRDEGLEPLERFEDAWHDHDRRAAANWWHCMHKGKSLYLWQVRAYLEAFPRDRMHILLFEDFARQPARVLNGLWAFLGVAPLGDGDRPAHSNQSGEIDNWLLRQLWRRTTGLRAALMPLVPLPWRGRLFPFIASRRRTRRSNVPPLDPELRERLTLELRDDILRLQDLIDRDLMAWLAPPQASPAVRET
jgi:hypothetical protein